MRLSNAEWIKTKGHIKPCSSPVEHIEIQQIQDGWLIFNSLKQKDQNLGRYKFCSSWLIIECFFINLSKIGILKYDSKK